MVLGSGMLATKFKEFQDSKFIFLTSGVSDSLCTNNKEFEREFSLVEDNLKKHSDQTFVYFSSTSIFTKVSPYTEHKKKIENLIINSGKKYYIFRIPQIVGKGGNPKNLFNFLKEKIKNNEELIIFNNRRSFVDIDDFFEIIIYILNNHQDCLCYNFFEIESLPVIDILNLFFNLLKIKTEYKISDNLENNYGKNSLEIDISIDKLLIRKKNYTKNLIKKYLN